jgi:hypothetical protein
MRYHFQLCNVLSMSASSSNTKPTDASSSSKGNLVAVVKDRVHSLGKRMRDAFSPSKASPVRGTYPTFGVILLTQVDGVA